MKTSVLDLKHYFIKLDWSSIFRDILEEFHSETTCQIPDFTIKLQLFKFKNYNMALLKTYFHLIIGLGWGNPTLIPSFRQFLGWSLDLCPIAIQPGVRLASDRRSTGIGFCWTLYENSIRFWSIGSKTLLFFA